MFDEPQSLEKFRSKFAHFLLLINTGLEQWKNADNYKMVRLSYKSKFTPEKFFLALALVDVSKRICSKFTNADIISVMIMALTFIIKLPTDRHHLQLPS
jgi:hypothetical protein